MEQKTSVDTSSKKLDDSNNSLPQKRAKRQPEEKSSPSETTSNDAAVIAGNLNHQQPSNIEITDNQQPSKNGIFDFILPSVGDSIRVPGEIQTPTVWRACELEEFGTSLLRRLTLLKLKKGHCLAT